MARNHHFAHACECAFGTLECLISLFMGEQIDLMIAVGFVYRCQSWYLSWQNAFFVVLQLTMEPRVPLLDIVNSMEQQYMAGMPPQAQQGQVMHMQGMHGHPAGLATPYGHAQMYGSMAPPEYQHFVPHAGAPGALLLVPVLRTVSLWRTSIPARFKLWTFVSFCFSKSADSWWTRCEESLRASVLNFLFLNALCSFICYSPPWYVTLRLHCFFRCLGISHSGVFSKVSLEFVVPGTGIQIWLRYMCLSLDSHSSVFCFCVTTATSS